MDDYGDIRAWHTGIESVEVECDYCEEKMELVSTDYTAKLAVYKCPVCEDTTKLTIGGKL